MTGVNKYQEAIKTHLSSYAIEQEPNNLYQPIRYIVSLGGKRLRPLLTLLATDIFNGDYLKALDAALAIELFHNFTLVHDDIMDGAPMRRGAQTVHNKWDINTGILSGDAMLILSYQLFNNYELNIFHTLITLFSKTALEVCEGQQYDIDFESRDDVSISEYLKMIEYKTAVLIGASMKMGAIIANAPENDQNEIYDFGKNLGVAFQLQDDYLDAFGDPQTFGKQTGGDIIENKKTYLYLKAMEFGSANEKKQLQKLFMSSTQDASQKISIVKSIYEKSGSAQATQEAILKYTKQAFDKLHSLNISEPNKKILHQFGLQLMNRTF